MNPDFNCCSNFVLSWVDKVTTVTKKFVLAIAKFIALSPSEITQCAGQVRIRLSSQLIKGISGVLQKLLKYFNGTAIFAFIIFLSWLLSKNFDLNDSESVTLLFESSLENWYKVSNISP